MKRESNDIDLRRIWREMKRRWWLYAACFIVFMTLAATYCTFRMPTYNSRATLLIEDSSPEGAALAAAASNSAALRMLSMSSAAVANEMNLINSNDVLSRVVRQAGLNVTYVRRDGLGKQLLYPAAPVRAAVPQQVLDTLHRGVNIKVHMHDGVADLRAVKGPKGIFTAAEAEGVKLPYTFKTPTLAVRIEPAEGYNPAADENIDIIISGTQAVVENMRKDLTIEVNDKTSDAVDLEITDPLPLRGETILNCIMEQYNAKRLNRKRETAATELEYCNDRLQKLIQQLNESEAKVERFKRDNNLTAMALDSAGWMAQAIGSRASMARSQNALTYYDQVLYTLNKDNSGNSFIPVSLAGETPNPLAEEYNRLVSEKRELERSATPEHPSMQSINERIAKMRSTIITDFSQGVERSRRDLGTMHSLSDEAKAKVSTLPGLERELFDLMRDKAIKNEMYLYLLQRREAAELRLYSTDTTGFVVDAAYSDIKPSKTKGMIALVAAFLLSLALPTLLLWWLMRRRDVVRESVDLKFIGLEEASFRDEDIRVMRSRLAAMEGKTMLYIADFTHTSAAQGIVATFNDVDMGIAMAYPDTDAAGNDAIETRAFREQAEQLMQQGCRCVAVEVPEPELVSEIAHLIDRPEAQLIAVVPCGKMRRRELRRLLRGQMTERILVCIMRS
ncbi:MAG TPA: hypothetical protein DC009_04265 [Porphyromonadaceae bacterium]|nr:hypothetical protein [Porphyromonadaceae bacterium]